MRQLKITNSITQRESASLEKYLADIGRIDLLTPEQEIVLAKRIKQGDEDALEQMTKANLRFVVSVAKKYQNQGLSLSDLINEGNVGLIKAARRFDETKGFKFISYAVWWVRQSILSAIVEYSRIVRLPHNKLTAYSKVKQALSDFAQKYEREPTQLELAELLGVEERDIANMIKANNRHLSIDAPLSDDNDGLSMLDLLSLDEDASPDMALLEHSVREEINESLEVLSPREVQILTAFFGLNGSTPMSIEEIADMHNLSKDRVRQVKEKAIRRMRKYHSGNSLFSIL